MVRIDADGRVNEISGSVEELCANAGGILSVVIRHILEKYGNEDVGYESVEVMMEATLQMVMNMIDNERGVESIRIACQTIGATGAMEKSTYKIMEGGMLS